MGNLGGSLARRGSPPLASGILEESMTLLGLAVFCCNVSLSLLSDTSEVDGCSTPPEPFLGVEKLALFHASLGLLEIT